VNQHCISYVYAFYNFAKNKVPNIIDFIAAYDVNHFHICVILLLADRTNGRAYATVLRLSVRLSVCDVMYCG